ncbi:MAG: SxtJ family membrane protein [Gemmatimonas sp.]
MGAGVSAGLKKAPMTAAEGRKFGLTVGLAFLAIGGLLVWRHHLTKSYFAFGVGGLLVVSGLIIPTLLGPVERAWMGLAHLISKVTTPIFMGVVYFLVITPIGFTRNFGGGGPIIRKGGKSGWTAHDPAASEPGQMERQF